MKAILHISLLILFSVFHQYKGLAQVEKRPVVQVKTLVTDFENHIRKGEQIYFVNIQSGTIFKAISNEYGKFDIDLPYGATYSIKIKSIGQAHDYNELAIKPYKEGEGFAYMELTILFEHPKYITLENVYFDTGKATLNRKSFVELNELVEFMRLKEDLKIEISGHTDNVGEAEDNLLLSQNRANTVRRYLISKNISADRIVAVGYGESQPVESNESADGRQKNRRTAVKFLED